MAIDLGPGLRAPAFSRNTRAVNRCQFGQSAKAKASAKKVAPKPTFSLRFLLIMTALISGGLSFYTTIKQAAEKKGYQDAVHGQIGSRPDDRLHNYASMGLYTKSLYEGLPAGGSTSFRVHMPFDPEQTVVIDYDWDVADAKQALEILKTTFPEVFRSKGGKEHDGQIEVDSFLFADILNERVEQRVLAALNDMIEGPGDIKTPQQKYDIETRLARLLMTGADPDSPFPERRVASQLNKKLYSLDAVFQEVGAKLKPFTNPKFPPVEIAFHDWDLDARYYMHSSDFLYKNAEKYQKDCGDSK